MRLVEADAILPKGTRITPDNVDLATAIRFAPTVDAVPVVRCRECRYRSKDGCPIIDANIWMDDDDFCSHGELKEDS